VFKQAFNSTKPFCQALHYIACSASETAIGAKESMQLKWLPWNKPLPGLVGVEVTADGVAFARILREGDSCQLSCCELLLNQEGELPAEQFVERIEQLSLQGSRCNLVLPVDHYQLLLIESPNVPDDELRDALRWKIKDLLSFPVEDALIDVFTLPKGSNRGGRQMLYVVAAEEPKVKKLMSLLDKAQLQLDSIDITEMALRNLAEVSTDDQRSLAVLRVLPGQGMLTLLRAGQLYLSRQFDMPYNGGLFDELPEEQLVLELQRSLDYYERQMGQVPPSNVYICGENMSPDKVTESLNASLSANFSVLNIGSGLTLSDSTDDSILQACATAIGAALRLPEVK